MSNMLVSFRSFNLEDRFRILLDRIGSYTPVGWFARLGMTPFPFSLPAHEFLPLRGSSLAGA